MPRLEASFSAPVNTYRFNSHATRTEAFYLCIHNLQPPQNQCCTEIYVSHYHYIPSCEWPHVYIRNMIKPAPAIYESILECSENINLILE